MKNTTYILVTLLALSATLLTSCGKDNPKPDPQPEPGGGQE